MERRVFILLVLLIVSVILNIFLATKIFKFKRQLSSTYHEYTNSVHSKFNEYEKKANKVENKIEDKVKDKAKNISKSNINNSISNK